MNVEVDLQIPSTLYQNLVQEKEALEARYDLLSDAEWKGMLDLGEAESRGVLIDLDCQCWPDELISFFSYQEAQRGRDAEAWRLMSSSQVLAQYRANLDEEYREGDSSACEMLQNFLQGMV
jgi:hypothetical protein